MDVITHKWYFANIVRYNAQARLKMQNRFSLSHLSAGFVSILVGYSSAAAIVFQAAVAGGATPEQVGSWLWALGLGLGVGGIGFSLYYRQPIVLAWSTPGAALLVTSLPGVAMSDAIGAFMVSSALILICGLTGWFDRIMRLVPQSLAAAMLAGVLLRFGLGVFPAFQDDSLTVGIMVTAYVLGKWQGFRYTIPVTFLSGVIMAAILGKIDPSGLSLSVTQPVWITPSFDLSVIIGVGIPLFVVTMASQNVPGIAVLRAHGYQASASPVISSTGLLGLILGPFGGFAYNFAAITAAICMRKDVDENPERRYLGAVWAGAFYILAGLFGITVASFFATFPAGLVATIAGLALLGTIANSLQTGMEKEGEREAAIFTFVVTASSGSLLSVGAPFWGLVIGLVVYHFNTTLKKPKSVAH